MPARYPGGAAVRLQRRLWLATERASGRDPYVEPWDLPEETAIAKIIDAIYREARDS